MLKTMNNKIQRKFSESAKSYDRFSNLQREIADGLLIKIVQEQAPLVLLDVGCGTGYLTGKLKDHFSQSKIIGLDFAQGMLAEASLKHNGISWVLANGNNLPFADGSINILTSNLAYQWVKDLPQAFSEVQRVLASNGVLACTLFGYNTCQELFQSLDEAKKGAFQFMRLPNEVQVNDALVSSGFKNTQIDCEQIKIEFKDMHELITWLKSIGANNLSQEGYLGKDALARAEAIYRKDYASYNGVIATFEVIRVYGKK